MQEQRVSTQEHVSSRAEEHRQVLVVAGDEHFRKVPHTAPAAKVVVMTLFAQAAGCALELEVLVCYQLAQLGRQVHGALE
jgi:hypothetical protein